MIISCICADKGVLEEAYRVRNLEAELSQQSLVDRDDVTNRGYARRRLRNDVGFVPALATKVAADLTG
jgi:hypothetical protein